MINRSGVFIQKQTEISDTMILIELVHAAGRLSVAYSNIKKRKRNI